MSGLRQLKRSVMKHELGTNNISDTYHKKYGYHIQKTKAEIKAEKAAEKQLLKFARKKARAKRIQKLFAKGEK